MTSVETVPVLIADDDSVLREALSEMVGLQATLSLVGAAATAAEAVEMAGRLSPKVVLMDVRMPGGGATATREIRSRHPDIQVVAFTAYENRGPLLEMVRAGANGYVVKGASVAEIVDAVHAAAAGQTVLSPGVSAELVQELSSRLDSEEQATLEREQVVARVLRVMSGGMRTALQPIVELDSGTTAGVEALARFKGHPTRGPLEWFNEARAVGLERDLEVAALRAALLRRETLPQDLYFCVNISPATLIAGADLGQVDGLVIEFTERTPVDDYGRLRDVLGPLRECGLKLAIDDAGAGYASLRHILRLDPDFIKLDGSLIEGIVDQRNHRAMAAALISMADAIGADVIAEGVETVEQWHALQGFGVRYGQGFLFGRPSVDLGDRGV